LNFAEVAKIPTNAKPPGVLLGWIVNLENDDLGATVPIDVGNCNSSSLVEPGKPVN
jgi:hypothetical protein